MQLRKSLMMLTALSALSAVMMGCPSDETGNLTCSLDADCIEGEICHPAAKVCVKTCTAGADCPSSAKTCDVISTTDSRKVCECSTDQLCNSDGATNLVCSSLDKVCAPKCTTDASCGTGRTCDTATGQCKAGNTGTTCTYGSCTGANEVCNATTNKCEAAAACTGSAQSTCAYGEFCGSTGKCADAPKPTCGNLEGKAAASFAPASGTGNIIYDVQKVSFAPDSAGCPSASAPIKVVPRVSFYVKSGTVPADQSAFSGFFYVTTDKGETPLGAANLFNYTKAADNKSASVSVFLCAADINTITMGFYFTGGNGYCATFTR